MVRHESKAIRFAPLVILSFPLLAPHHLLEAEKFNIRFTDPAQITETADKLRWYRYREALLQREVANLVGIDRSTYLHYEGGETEYFPLEIMEKIAALYDIPVTDLLDEYNTFLYRDQGKQIKERRKALRMTQREYADYLGVSFGSLQNWEQNNVRMFKRTWERYFKLVNKKRGQETKAPTPHFYYDNRLDDSYAELLFWMVCAIASINFSFCSMGHFK